MKAFNAALLSHAFRQLTKYERSAAASDSPDDEVKRDQLADVSLTLAATKAIAYFIQLRETNDAIARLESDMNSQVEKITNVGLQHALHHLLELMQSELDKRKVFAVDPEKSKYYQDDIYGIESPELYSNALFSRTRPAPLFSQRVVAAFPSAYMDIVEAGRCLALNRNNAAVYHLMQVAEIGLRILAWDRRIDVKRGKKQVVIPLNYAQWGEMIGQLQKAELLINQWSRSKSLREEAGRYYRRAVLEVDSFNEIFRKHISHARGELYQPDTAINCWGHVYRFMDTLAERMSETQRTPKIWNSPKKTKKS